MKKTCLTVLLAGVVMLNYAFTLPVAQAGTLSSGAAVSSTFSGVASLTIPVPTYYCGSHYCGPSGDGGFPPYTTFQVHSNISNSSQVTWVVWNGIEHEFTGLDYGSYDVSTHYVSFMFYTESGWYEYSGYLD